MDVKYPGDIHKNNLNSEKNTIFTIAWHIFDHYQENDKFKRYLIAKCVESTKLSNADDVIFVKMQYNQRV